MAFEAYLKIKGESQGDFKGESTRKGREDWIPLLRSEWGIESLANVATGAAAGRRRHQPFGFWKEPGAATPQIFRAICNNENLTEVTFELVRTSKQGQDEVFMTFHFTDARLLSVKYETGSAELGDESGTPGGTNQNDPSAHEVVRLTYRQVEITDNISSTSAVDSWDAVYS